MSDNILGLFFTRGISLEMWEQSGLLGREKLLYEEHLKKSHLKKVFWFTYGSSDENVAIKLKKEGKLHQHICVFGMPQIFKIPMVGSWLYSLCLPIVHKRVLKKCTFIKSNQMDGSWSAMLAAKLHQKYFINRTGFTLSLFGKRKNLSLTKQFFIRLLELIVYRHANIIIVASENDRQYLLQTYKLQNKNLHLLHNYIDAKLFRPNSTKRSLRKIVFVGRLDHQKNLFNLIAAVDKVGLELDIYGDGILKDQLIGYSEIFTSKINFKGVVTNSALPKILNKYLYFILPSYYEGMPKTLLEAMACGCVCIGTRVSGIEEVLDHGVNGYLSDQTDTDSLVKAINSAIGSDDLPMIAENARITVLENFSLEKIVQKEQQLLQEINGS